MNVRGGDRWQETASKTLRLIPSLYRHPILSHEWALRIWNLWQFFSGVSLSTQTLESEWLWFCESHRRQVWVSNENCLPRTIVNSSCSQELRWDTRVELKAITKSWLRSDAVSVLLGHNHHIRFWPCPGDPSLEAECFLYATGIKLHPAALMKN